MMYATLGLLALVAAKPKLVAHEEYSEDSDEPTICYGDDECRGKEVCDMGSYICVLPTPSPIWTTPSPTDAPGCCYNPDSYKGNDRCAGATDQGRCEDMGCTFLVTDDPEDCKFTTTESVSSTYTTEIGCCYGDSERENAMCLAKGTTQEACERGGGNCVFREGADADCTFVPTTTTEEVGCCYGLDNICGDRLDSKSCARRPEDCEWRVGEVAPCTIVKDTTTAEPGCCYNPDSYKGNDKCAAMSDDQERCEKQGCTFLVTDDPDDCVFTTTETPTTTEDVGCCMGDSFKTNAMCNNRLTRAQCDRSSSCTFVDGGVLEDGDCDFGTTQPPDEPGCCYGNPDIAYSKRWMEQCKDYGTERECLMLEDDDGNKRCTFEPMNEYMDCEAVWPTTTETPAGCCRGDGYKSNDKCRRNDYDQAKCEAQGCEFVVTDDFEVCEYTTTETPTTTSEVGCCKADAKKREDMCLSRDTEAKCLRSASCVEWISGPEADCSFEETTTEEPGCCYINPDQAYSKKYQDTCITFGTERECLMLTDSNGVSRCVFEPMNEYGDCSMLWPTTTETPTEAPGCCRGDSYKSNDKCRRNDNDQAKCEKQGCEFVETDDFEVCEYTTTETPTTTVTPGCCKGTNRNSNDACNAIEDPDQCDRRSSCTFIAFGNIDIDCVFPPTEPPSEPGCCYGNPDIGYSARWMEECKKFGTEEECTMLTNGDGEPRCVFEPLGEYEDCETVWPTTTTTSSPAPGCCKGDSYKQNDKCRGFDNDEAQCERKGCEFIETDDFSVCDITTTETPTTTVTPGCCKGTSRTSNDACNAIEDPDQCDRRSSCTFIAFGNIAVDCVFPPTEPPSEPGCCYGNPDIAYSARWMEQCKKFGTEEECLMLKNDDGEPRCYFEPLGEYEDCETVWPTTTETPTEPAGCCYGDSYKANDKCRKMDDDKARCEKQGCNFLVTDDPDDCDVTTTSTETPPTTTSEVGCCYGEGVKENEMCGNKVGRDQCERSGQCEFRSGIDADCEYTETTTTAEPGCCYGDTAKTNEMCGEKIGRDQCERSGKCEFISGEDADCTLPTTTSEPWLEAKDEDYSLPYNPYKQSKKSSRKGANRHQEEAMLFGGDNMVGQAMHYQVSLSSVLMMVVAAFAVYQVYRWMSARKNKEYEAVQTRPVQYYQSA